MFEKYQTRSRNLIDANPYWDYVIEEYVMPNNKVGKYYYAHTLGSTIVIPKIDDKRFVLTIQYRYLNKNFSIEFPGGGLRGGLTPEENALEELIQETGYRANKLQLLGKFNPCNGLTDEICFVYLAEELDEGEQKPDESEEIRKIILNEKEISEKIKTGEIWDGMTLASFSIYLHLF